ncbi:MAG: efflux RND transporter periplasmic adaptor subunit [Xanthobacteraceae bacterium]
MAPRTTPGRLGAMVAAVLLAVAVVAYWTWHSGGSAKSELGVAGANAEAPGGPAHDPNSVDLSDSQLSSVKVAPVEEREFPIEKTAVGSIDFNEDMAVQVFAPYQGRIISLFAQIGDDVKKGQTLFTIDSPDLLQAESTLIAAAGVADLQRKNLDRLHGLVTTQAVSQRDVEQAVSDQQTAEGNLQAARDAVRLFGKTEDDIKAIISKRSADPTLVVPSPITGRITARDAAPGLFVQPGNTPAPYMVADVDTMWMLANVAESDSPAFRVGQPAQVRLDAFPGRVFDGAITTIGASVDANTRRVLVRSEVKDPQHELRSGMFAVFVIRVGAPIRSPAIPIDGVVREGDGTMTAWVTADRRHFVRRLVKIGEQRDGYRQILAGVQTGELAATEGAIFLSNELAISE